MDINPITEILKHLFATVAVIFVARKILQMYLSRGRLPPGPFPWPVIGNLLLFKKKAFSHEVMNEIADKYGPVFTIFLGSTPNVVISDPDLVVNTLKKHTFAGRPPFKFAEWMFPEDSTDIAMADFGKEWEALRKIGHSAARKFAMSPQLSPIVTNVVDKIFTRFGHGPVDSNEMFTTLMIAVLAEAAFGQRYNFTDPEFVKWKETFEMQNKNASFLVMLEFVPFFRYLFRKRFKTLKDSTDYQWQYIGLMYKRAEDNYTEGKNECFCDAIITAKKEAVAQENWMNPYLHPQNVMNAVSDLFSAGTDTTRMTLRWIFLLMSKHSDWQGKMRKQVNEMVGPVAPKVEDCSKCPLVCAFISETLRYRPIAPTNLPHKTTVDEEANGIKIPEGTTIIFSLYNALTNDKVWGDPHTFRPDRFLEADGKHTSKPNPYYIPFGGGRRSCPGDKLAFNNMFLIVTRFLQKTTDIQVVGGVTEDHIRGDLAIINFLEPIPFSLNLTLRSLQD